MLRKPSIFARLVDKIRSLPQIIAPHARGRFEKKPGAGLAQKLGIKAAPVTGSPKRVEVILQPQSGEDQNFAERGAPKRVVRVLADGKWVKKI